MKILFLILISLVQTTVFSDNHQLNNSTAVANNDPYENTNRKIFVFNQALDENVLIPIATRYKKYTPTVIQDSINNFFSNLAEIPTFANQLLQLKIGDGANTIVRFLVNSSFGLYGIVDVATDIDINKKNEDFGQTLGFYGVDSGPYLTLPVLGPSSLRDVFNIPVGQLFSIDMDLKLEEEILLSQLNIINIKTNLLPMTNMLYKSPDPYATMRSLYLQNRIYQINDGAMSVNDIDF